MNGPAKASTRAAIGSSQKVYLRLNRRKSPPGNLRSANRMAGTKNPPSDDMNCNNLMALTWLGFIATPFGLVRACCSTMSMVVMPNNGFTRNIASMVNTNMKMRVSEVSSSSCSKGCIPSIGNRRRIMLQKS